MSETKPVAWKFQTRCKFERRWRTQFLDREIEANDYIRNVQPLYPASALTSLMEENERLRENVATLAHNWQMERDLKVEYVSAMRAAEARVKELETALDAREIESGLTRDGNLWRFWSQKAKDVATKLAAAEARAQAADQEIERLLLFGGRMANACYNIAWASKATAQHLADLAKSQGDWDEAAKVSRRFIKEAGE